MRTKEGPTQRKEANMRYAAVVMLATVVGLAVFYKSDLPPALEEPAAPPPAQVEPPVELPQFIEDYDAAMREKDRKVILVFGAEWCPHCVTLKENLKGMNLDGYLVCLVDVEKHKGARKYHAVRILPTSVILKDGKEMSRKRGFEKQGFEAWVEGNR